MVNVWQIKGFRWVNDGKCMVKNGDLFHFVPFNSEMFCENPDHPIRPLGLLRSLHPCSWGTTNCMALQSCFTAVRQMKWSSCSSLGRNRSNAATIFFSKERLRHLLLHVGSVGTIFLVTVIMIPKWDGIWKTWNDQQPLRPLLPSFSSEPRENQEIAFPKWSPKKEQLA